jgi:hypothetical protein
LASKFTNHVTRLDTSIWQLILFLWRGWGNFI